ncbi:MAG: hypothetical protein NUV72_09500 [Bauldia sp.]|nr:hypothetical protein [Bauldia sp.]
MIDPLKWSVCRRSRARFGKVDPNFFSAGRLPLPPAFGLWIALARFQRCGPFGASGHDPIPDALPENSAWYMPWRYGRWTGRHIDPRTRLDLHD